MPGLCVGWFDLSSVFVPAVFAEELGKGDGSFMAGLQSMLLDGSLQEVCSVLSKALYGEPLVNQPKIPFQMGRLNVLCSKFTS